MDVGKSDDLLDPSRQVVLAREPEEPRPLGLHVANLDHIAHLVADIVASPGPDSVNVGFKPVGMSMEHVGIENQRVPGPSEQSDFTGRVTRSRERSLADVNVRAGLVVALIIVDTQVGTISRPVSPNVISVAEERRALRSHAVDHVETVIIGFLLADRVETEPYARAGAEARIGQAFRLP